MSIIYQHGFEFGFDPEACSRCAGNCCRGKSGTIRVNQDDIFRISGVLKMNMVDFIMEYLVPIEGGYSVRESFTGEEFECIFFDSGKNQCGIYVQRPLQCRRFPFWDVFRKDRDLLLKECPGVLLKPAQLRT